MSFMKKKIKCKHGNKAKPAMGMKTDKSTSAKRQAHSNQHLFPKRSFKGKTLEWIRSIRPFRSLLYQTEIFCFPFVWSLFEYEYRTNDSASVGVRALQEIAKKQKAKLREDPFVSAWEHFQVRYVTADKINGHFDELFGNNRSGKSIVKNTLESSCASPYSKAEALLIIVYRLRNNFFHGTKIKYEFKDQYKNFYHANSVLRQYIEWKNKE